MTELRKIKLKQGLHRESTQYEEQGSGMMVTVFDFVQVNLRTCVGMKQMLVLHLMGMLEI